MGGKGSGYTREKRLVNAHFGRNNNQQIIPAGENFIIPNHSGDHSSGRVDSTPVNDYDLVNKAYVDSLGGVTTLTTLEVFNNTGSTLAKGAPVYLSGWNVGQEAAEVTLADADNATAMPCVGLMASSLTAGSKGTIVVSGSLTNTDTSSWSVDDELWVSTTAGVLTNTKPTGLTTAVQKMAQVVRSHASNGVLIIFGAGRSNDIPNSSDRAFDMGSNKITSVTDPTSDQDAATKKYVDDNTGGSFGAGDYYLISADTEESTTSSTYVKAKEIKIHQGGTLRIKFDLKSSSGIYAVYGRVYRNGVAVGTQQGSTSTSYATKSEDISGWSAGDLVQLYIKRTGGVTAYVKDFTIYVDDYPGAQVILD